MVHDQVVTDHYAIYNSDCMHVVKELPNDSIDLSVYSPPIRGTVQLLEFTERLQ